MSEQNPDPLPRSILMPLHDHKEYEHQAALALACAWNTLDESHLAPLLDANTVYESQNVLQPLVGINAILDYLRGKFVTLSACADTHKVYAEIGRMAESYKERPCVIIAQQHPDKLLAVVLFETERGRIKRLDFCTCAPNPSHAIRTGQYPT